MPLRGYTDECTDFMGCINPYIFCQCTAWHVGLNNGFAVGRALVTAAGEPNLS
jgi:hypothetical protein